MTLRSRTSRLRRSIAGLGLTAALIGGGGIAFATPANAQDDKPARERPAAEERADRVEERIQRLLDSDRISEEQAQHMRDRFAKAQAARAEKMADHAAAQQALADLLGLSVEELHTALKDGSSLADIAQTADVDKQAVVDHLLERAASKLDQAVAADKLTQAQADAKRDQLREGIEAKVDGDTSDKGNKRGGKRRGGHHHRGPRGSR